MNGCVYLVGAGCGSADLITLRGLELLRRCDALIYDDLIDPALLEDAPPSAQRIYMGKRSGQHSASQEEISAELIRQARLGRVVVRLKGGDPYVFGRGGEEFLALKAAGIPCEEVPGISSAIAIPAAAGIPVTHRKLSRSLHIITGHTADTADGLPQDFDHLAKLQGTLVFLMGLRQLPRIAQRLMEAGKSPDTPAAVVSGGSSPHPAKVRGTLSDIAARAEAAGVVTPAVILLGEVAAMDLSSTIPRPLEGVRVGLTGTAAITKKLSPALKEQGARVHVAQRHLLVEPDTAMDGWTPEAAGGWLVFTSGNGVDAFFRGLDRRCLDRRCLAPYRFAVIGAATGKRLRAYGYQADLCPAVYTSEELGKALLSAVPVGAPVTLFRSAQADARLYETLSAAGHTVTDLRVYDVVPQAPQGEAPEVDYLVFASAGGVRAYWAAFGEPRETVTCVCIGAITAKALRRLSARPILMASEISAQGILQAIQHDHCD